MTQSAYRYMTQSAYRNMTQSADVDYELFWTRVYHVFVRVASVTTQQIFAPSNFIII